ncbi:YopX family protein [Macrococcus armenti]|uniref:YopX family protein n=1 Tax=Macrococcus armenti TaxID=2875764 RepID=UPI001CD66BA8|nr:YopX family protein [Macrococcus armenti]UBH10617.1 YopX family protein [Macrococcus armenti]
MIPKFRVWEDDVKYMNDQVRITQNFLGIGETIVDVSEGMGWKRVDEKYLMQSTGLKDKNGKEIYEGDIINCRNLWLDGDRRKTHKQIVKYDSGMFSAGYVSLRTNNSTSEVIGNIYENPELLQ